MAYKISFFEYIAETNANYALSSFMTSMSVCSSSTITYQNDHSPKSHTHNTFVAEDTVDLYGYTSYHATIIHLHERLKKNCSRELHI